MKILLALLGSLLMVTGKSRPKRREFVPAKAPAKADAEKKTDEAKDEGQIKGIVVPRGDRGFLGIEIVNSTFKISFYDAKKKPIAPDMARAVLTWDPKYKQGKDRVVLNPGDDGKSLSSPRNIRPPYAFKLIIHLIKDATENDEAAGENYVIDFRA